jgi:hypothetical protein
VLGPRYCEPGDAQIDQQRDAKAVRQHQRFGHAFRCVGEQTKRASAVTALALRTRWHRLIGLLGSVQAMLTVAVFISARHPKGSP